jgi:hypothetical protein
MMTPMICKYWLQYRSVDLHWYDSSPYLTLDEAKDAYDTCLANRPKGNYRIVERTDVVIWPREIDPASSGGA